MSQNGSEMNQSESTGPQQPTGSQEQVVARLRSQGRRLILPALLFIAIPGTAAYFFGSFPQAWENVMILVAAGIAVLLFCLLPLLFWLSTTYTITTRRIVVRRGLFTQFRQELLHSRSYDLTVKRSPMQRFTGSGDIWINTGLEKPVILKNIPDVLTMQRALQELMERGSSRVAARRQLIDAAAADSGEVQGTRMLARRGERSRG